MKYTLANYVHITVMMNDVYRNTGVHTWSMDSVTILLSDEAS